MRERKLKWWSDGCDVLEGEHEADIGVVCSTSDPESAAKLAQHLNNTEILVQRGEELRGAFVTEIARLTAKLAELERRCEQAETDVLEKAAMALHGLDTSGGPGEIRDRAIARIRALKSTP